MFQVPESTGRETTDPWDKTRRGQRAMNRALLLGLVTLTTWFFRDFSEVIRYAILVPATLSACFCGYGMMQFKEGGEKLEHRVGAFGIMSLNMFPVVHLMTWWTSH